MGEITVEEVGFNDEAITSLQDFMPDGEFKAADFEDGVIFHAGARGSS